MNDTDYLRCIVDSMKLAVELTNHPVPDALQAIEECKASFGQSNLELWKLRGHCADHDIHLLRCAAVLYSVGMDLRAHAAQVKRESIADAAEKIAKDLHVEYPDQEDDDGVVGTV